MATRAEVEVLPTREALMEAAAARVVSAARAAIEASGRFVVALAGGSTPKALYALLAGAPWAGRVDWSGVHVFWGDERCVPPDDPASNYRMTREALLAHVPVSEQNVHRIRGEDDPRRAAAAYERVLRETFATPVGPPRHAPGARFDLVLLGMGDNGHTASLFPGQTAVRETERWVVAERVEEVGLFRVIGFVQDRLSVLARRDNALAQSRKEGVVHSEQSANCRLEVVHAGFEPFEQQDPN